MRIYARQLIAVAVQRRPFIEMARVASAPAYHDVYTELFRYFAYTIIQCNQ